MSVILLSLIPMIWYGLYDYIISKPSKKISSSTLMSLIVTSNLIVFSMIFLVSWQQFVFQREIIYMLFAAITWYIWLTMYSRSLKTWNPGINSSIANAYPAITVCIWYFFFKEYLSLYQLWFLLCILLWIIFSSFHIDEIKSLSLSKSKTSIMYALWATIMWALYVTCLDVAVNYFHPIIMSLYVDIFWLFLVLPLVLLKRKSICVEVRNISKNSYWYIALLACIWGASSIGFWYAFSLWSLAIVSAIAACSPVVTTLVSRIFWDEKLEMMQYLAIWVLVFWISWLSYFSI